jgi:hypothetical protein
MLKRVLFTVVLVLVCGPSFAFSASAETTHAHAPSVMTYRPDEWIKLCGQSTGCTVGPPPPHPWHGNNVYNASALNQTIRVRMEDGEGVRFWILLQNDGTQSDTFTVRGCQGTPRFVINAVLVGFWKKPEWRPRHITQQFQDGTATFALAAGARVGITLNILAPSTKEGITFRCPVTVTSSGDPTLKDTVAGIVTTT